MDPSPTGFYRVVQKVSDVIPVLEIMSRLPLLFSWALSSVVAYVGHIFIRTVWHRAIQVGQGVSTGWAKNFQKISNFWAFRDFTSLYLSNSYKLQLKAYDPSQEKILLTPLFTCCTYRRISHSVYRMGQKVSGRIPILRITAIAPEPMIPFLFVLSVVKCGQICRAQTCAHYGTEPSRLAAVSTWRIKNLHLFRSFLVFASPISQQPLK